jgi:glycosyltransferase involved in cell wall biosynthesis
VGEIKRMAETSIELLSNPQKHELFKHQARNRATQSFTADQIIPQYEAFYEEILRA